MRRITALVLVGFLAILLGKPSTAQLNTINYYPTSGGAIVAGPDGALWFSAVSSIGRITMTGTVTHYPIPNSSVATASLGITAGSDGNIWFTTQSNGDTYIGRACAQISPTCKAVGKVTEYPVPTYSAMPWEITAGSDGNVWFAEVNAENIGRVCTQKSADCASIGTITEYPAGGEPFDITTGPDGQLWFTELNGPTIKTMDMTGAITGSYPLLANEEPLRGIATGPDGALWFGEDLFGGGAVIARICAAVSPGCASKGLISRFPLDASVESPGAVAAGPDGALWFTASKKDNTSIIGRITTPNGKKINYYAVGSSGFITSGPDGALWFGGTQIGQAIPSARRNSVDVSLYINKIPNNTTLTNFKQAGVQYAVVQGTQLGGSLPHQILQKFQQYSNDGFKFGTAAYCFLYLYTGNSYGPGNKQIDNCLASLKKELAAGSLSFVALDVECYQPDGNHPPCYSPNYEPLTMRIQDITAAINELSSAAGVKKELIYTNASNWSFLSGSDATLNQLASIYDLWNAAHGRFTDYIDSAGNFLCSPTASSLTPVARGGTGIPSLSSPGFGAWKTEHGTQYEIDSCLFGIKSDFDVLDPLLFQ